jgi:choline dehydrogenase-like flavoprotein
VRPNAGPLGVGTFTYELSDQSIAVREAANAAMQAIVQRAGLARFMKLTFPSSFTAHPLGGCRMAANKDEGVVDHRGEAFGNEGLFCIDSSAIPSALGVNPSLTISAVSERAVSMLIDRAADYGLPAKPAGFAPGTPGVTLGPHTPPVRSSSDASIDAKVRSYA